MSKQETTLVGSDRQSHDLDTRVGARVDKFFESLTEATGRDYTRLEDSRDPAVYDSYLEFEQEVWRAFTEDEKWRDGEDNGHDDDTHPVLRALVHGAQPTLEERLAVATAHLDEVVGWNDEEVR